MTKKELKDAYKLQCRIRYYSMLTAYFIDFSVKVYLLYMVGGVYAAYAGALIDFVAKWMHLKQTKFRKKGFYQKKKNRRKKK